MMVRATIGECPNDLARLLAEAKTKDDEVTAKRKEASKSGPSCEKEGISPSAYLKGRYKENAKRDAKEEGKACCNRCGKTNTKLSKCGRCLSVFYCSKECQKADHVTHKKECKNLLKQRIQATRKDVDVAQSKDGCVYIPRIAVALSESITGIHGEVICHLPCWIIEELAGITRDRYDAKKFARQIRYFFKVYQSSVEAAKSLSVKDVGDMCVDAIVLYWMKHPGVRRVFAEEAASAEKFTLEFTTFMDKPDGWSIVGFEDRFAKIIE